MRKRISEVRLIDAYSLLEVIREEYDNLGLDGYYPSALSLYEERVEFAIENAPTIAEYIKGKELP